MLLNFSVKNFAAIGETQHLNLMTGKARGKAEHLLKAGGQRTLKFLSIYGANAAGKSTIIRAMHFGKNMILNGSQGNHFYSVNRTSDFWKEQPTEFTYTLFLNKKFYEYGFSLSWNEKSVIKEWLVEKNSKSEPKTIFVRDFASEKFDLNIKVKNSDIAMRLSVYFADAAKDRLLFLHAINTRTGDLFDVDTSLGYLRTIYRWFLTKLKFVYPHGSELGRYSFLNYPDNHDKLYCHLSDLGISISDMSRVKISAEQAFRDVPPAIVKEIETSFRDFYQQQEHKDGKPISLTMRLPNDYCVVEANADGILSIETISFTHGKQGTFGFNEESDGTKRILELLEMITSPEQDITYVVDEIDRSLHPLLTEQLISAYLNPEEPNQNQLIVTTHESRLLNLKKLRKDEIYFATNINGQSQFIRLDEYEQDSPRTDLNIELAYLSGRYTGIPRFIKREDA